MSDELNKWKLENLDPVSTSFCAAKWLNSSIHLGHGYTHSCHLPLPHQIDKTLLETDPSAIHNTAHKKIQREKMLKGERPSECEYCWKIEDIGRKNISDRVYKSMIYNSDDINKIATMDPNTNVIPKTLEISFDRTCNLACSYCNAGYSTTWAADIRNNGPYQQLKSDGGGAYQHAGNWAEPYGKFGTDNPYTKAFFEWWPELQKELLEIRITGGEPIMSHNFWKFCEMIKTSDVSNLRMAVNSNLCVKDDLIDNLIKFTKDSNLKEFDLYTSCEAYGAQAEYIRSGLDYNRWRNNLIYFIENANYRAVTIMMTINSLCLFSITEFLDDMIELKEKYGQHKPHIDLNILRWPSFMSPLALPDNLKTSVKNKLVNWFDTNKGNPLLVSGEKAQIQRLIDYLEVVETPHQRADTNKNHLHHDFKSFYSQYDVRRNKDFRSVFPTELVEWYDSIEIDSSIENIVVGTGEINHHD